jgi:hypothetical protein
MNKIKDGGDEYFVPLNMLNIKEDGTSWYKFNTNKSNGERGTKWA